MRRFEDIYKAGEKPWNGGYLYVASMFRKHPKGLYRAYYDARAAQAALWRAGVNAFSPIACFYPTALWEGINQTDHEWWMAHDRPYMEKARGLIVLKQPGWEESDGIKEERTFFAERNRPEWSLDFPVCL